MIPTIAVLVLTACLLAWMWIFELRLARLLDLAEGTGDQADRALGWITHYAAPALAEAVAEIHAFVPRLSNLVVSHEAVMRLLPDWMRADFPDPDPATIPDLPATVPEQQAVVAGQRQAEDHANGLIADAGFARIHADIENDYREWRATLAEEA